MVEVAVETRYGRTVSEHPTEIVERKEAIHDAMGQFLERFGSFEKISVYYNALDVPGAGLAGVYLSLLARHLCRGRRFGTGRAGKPGQRPYFHESAPWDRGGSREKSCQPCRENLQCPGSQPGQGNLRANRGGQRSLCPPSEQDWHADRSTGRCRSPYPPLGGSAGRGGVACGSGDFRRGLFRTR